MLGGCLARRDDSEAGVKTIWLGPERVVDFAMLNKIRSNATCDWSCV